MEAPAFLKPVAGRDDFQTVLNIRNEIWRHDSLTVDEAEAFDAKRGPGATIQRFLIDDRAFAVYGRPRAESNARFLQTFGRDPHDPRLDDTVAYLLDRAKHEGGDRAVSIVLSHQEADVARLRKFGFRVTQTNPLSRLDLLAFEPSPPSTEAKILPFAGLGDELGPDWRRKLWRLEMDLFADVPNPLPHEDTPFESYREKFESPLYSTETRFAALIDGELVGMTEFNLRRANPEIALTHLTGVRRQHRRKGIAHALKVAALTEAKRRGVREISTDNEENNPMYLLNQRLGFRKVCDLMVLTRDL